MNKTMNKIIHAILQLLGIETIPTDKVCDAQ